MTWWSFSLNAVLCVRGEEIFGVVVPFIKKKLLLVRLIPRLKHGIALAAVKVEISSRTFKSVMVLTSLMQFDFELVVVALNFMNRLTLRRRTVKKRV